MAGRKLRVAVLFGGRSSEHQVSRWSAESVIKNLDPARFEVIPISIDQEGQWKLNHTTLKVVDGQAPLYLPPDAQSETFDLMPTDGSGQKKTVDVFFPVLHGTNGEDGAIQGLFELTGVPYVGSGILGSAVGMDKEVSKRLLNHAGIHVVPWVLVRASEFNLKNADALVSEVTQKLGLPLFVKPAGTGSSVGVQKVKKADQLVQAVQEAFRFDEKVLIEKAIDAREIEFSVLESLDSKAAPQVSVAGEIIPKHEFYSYEAKYLDEKGAELIVPANLSSAQLQEGQKIAVRAFQCLELESMARVDFFLEKKTNRFFLNEVNTIPGFTTISMYPRMWMASGLSYGDLLSRLIDLAIARYKRRSKLVRKI